MVIRRLHSSRRALARGALAGGLMLCASVPVAAHAQTTSCRADPQIFLSNNYKVQMTATIPVASSDVREVDYSLNAPAGTHINSTVWTSNATYTEKLSFQAANTSKHYATTTTVYLNDGTVVTVTAQTSVNYQGTTSGGVVSASNTGPVGKPIPVNVTSK
jgi:hypothetical protein